MATQALSQQNAQQLVSELREMGINDDGIYYRFISEGFTPDDSTEIMQTAYHKPDVVLQRNWSLTVWLSLHILLIIPSLLILGLMVIAMINSSSMGGTILFSLLFVDALIQLWCINKLLNNQIIGFYGLMVLFALRFILAPHINLLDAIALCAAVYTSRNKIDTRKAKRKRS